MPTSKHETHPELGWDWFDSVTALELDPESEGQADMADVFARCFRGRDGERAMSYLRALTLDRALGPGVRGAVLRHVEGQRQLTAHIASLVARGQDK